MEILGFKMYYTLIVCTKNPAVPANKCVGTYCYKLILAYNKKEKKNLCYYYLAALDSDENGSA